jgi:hypothetical protein
MLMDAARATLTRLRTAGLLEGGWQVTLLTYLHAVGRS